MTKGHRPLFSSQPCVLKSGHTHVRCQLSLRMVAMRLRGRRAFFWQRPANLTSVCMFVQRAACNGRLHSLLRGGGTSLPGGREPICIGNAACERACRESMENRILACARSELMMLEAAARSVERKCGFKRMLFGAAAEKM